MFGSEMLDVAIANDPAPLRLDLGYPESELVFGLVFAAGTDYSGSAHLRELCEAIQFQFRANSRLGS